MYQENLSKFEIIISEWLYESLWDIGEPKDVIGNVHTLKFCEKYKYQ